MLIGIDQMDPGFDELSVPIDAIRGIALLFVDALMLTSSGGAVRLIVLPWAASAPHSARSRAGVARGKHCAEVVLRRLSMTR
ncbi:hypothetical protein [Cognatilysobacter terrigena]|uniref:hypothetical protein n=1 Tax=Cognatilysobacter terrigena TaxID=2488749 RepID=UPI00105B59AF|nr:hypothetical protein [Lysobacter terrigena]